MQRKEDRAVVRSSRISRMLSTLSRGDKLALSKLAGFRALASSLDLAGITFVAMSGSVIFGDLESLPLSLGDFLLIQRENLGGELLVIILMMIGGLLLSARTLLMIRNTKSLVKLVARIQTKATIRITTLFLRRLTFEPKTKSVFQTSAGVSCNELFMPLYHLVVLAGELTLVLVLATAMAAAQPYLFLFLAITGISLGFALTRFLRKGLNLYGSRQTEATSQTMASLGDVYSFRDESEAYDNKTWWENRVAVGRQSWTHSMGQLQALNSYPRYIIEIAVVMFGIFLATYVALTSSIEEQGTVLIVFLLSGFRLASAAIPIQNAANVITSNLAKGELALDILTESLEISSFDSSPSQDSHAPKRSGPEIQISRRSQERISSTLNISPGSLVVLASPSGTGKTTLLRALLLQERNTNDYLFDFRPKKFRVGYLPQDPRLIVGSLFDNVVVGRTIPDSQEKVEELMSFFNLGHLKSSLSGIHTSIPEKRIAGFSGGEKQRLGLARALVDNPELLILDEPTSALDVKNINKLVEKLEGLRGEATIVVASHDESLVEIADHVVRKI